MCDSHSMISLFCRLFYMFASEQMKEGLGTSKFVFLLNESSLRDGYPVATSRKSKRKRESGSQGKTIKYRIDCNTKYNWIYDLMWVHRCQCIERFKCSWVTRRFSVSLSFVSWANVKNNHFIFVSSQNKKVNYGTETVNMKRATEKREKEWTVKKRKPREMIESTVKKERGHTHTNEMDKHKSGKETHLYIALLDF